ncbi:MAG: hypothetical protein JW757_12730 [Anaerolineales bacterium]|nr:hypothetical protein [Anaerolineales bacterium]
MKTDTITPPTETPAPPTNTPLPTATSTPTPTAIPSTPLTAMVWEQDPFTVVLTYHQFAANHAKRSTALKVRFEDFEHQLNQLYEAGFSLVTLEDWLEGKIVVPAGRRPLILSLDDLYFNNQLRLDENGEPIEDCGLGVLWRFFQSHPDFGYSAALFVNLGNKLYGNPDDPDWEMQLAETIAWGMDHDLMPYNHFYTHPQLHISSADAIRWELEMNDNYLRDLLRMAEREDLIPELENYIALTYGVWPAPGNDKVMLSYQTPEGLPVSLVAEIDLIYIEKYLPAPYSPQFDRFHLPRHVASPLAIDFLAGQAEKFPTAQACDLGQVPDMLFGDAEGLADFVAKAAAGRGCPEGVYVLPEVDLLVRVTGGQGEVISLGD